MKRVNLKQICLALMFVILLCGSSLLSACQRKEADKTIYFLNFKPEIADVYKDIAKAYKEATGVTVKVNTAASNTYEQTLKSEIAKADAPTIFQINGPVGYNSWKNYCADLKNSRIYSILSDKGLAITGNDGGVYGVPYVIEGYGIIVNTAKTDEYFALAGRQTDVNSLDEIDSFETLAAVVSDMTAHLSELSINGVFGSTSLGTGEDWRWQTHLANIPFSLEADKYDYDLGVGVPEITFEFNPYMKNLFDLYIDNSVTDRKLLGSKSVADSMAEFALGQCAMIQNGNWGWSQINEVSGNTVAEENIRFLPLYTGVSGEESTGLCVGTENYLAVNSKASEEQQKLADDFLYWLFASDEGRSYVSDKLEFLTSFSTFNEDEVPDDPLAREINIWLNRDGVNSVPWDFTVFPSQDFKNDFGAALLGYAQGTRTWDDVVSTVVTRWRAESAAAGG